MSQVRVFSVFLLALAAGWGQASLDLVRSAGGSEAGRGALHLDARTVSGTVQSREGTIVGRVETSEGGLVRSYQREIRTAAGRLAGRVRLDSDERGGYAYREDSPIASRTLDLAQAPVHAVIDASWPEALIPVMLEREGFVRVLVLGGPEVRTVELKRRSDGARYLDLPGGGITLERDEGGRFRRLLCPDLGLLEIGLAGAAPPPGPALPEGVEEREVGFRSGDLALGGTLALPEAARRPAPGVVLVGGEGATDRDGRRAGRGSGLLRDIAHGLARAGWASLRYDKRGASGAGGAVRLAALQDDARAAAQALAEAEGVRPGRVAILGHGEGGLVAVEAAIDRPELFAAVLSLGAPARPLAEALEARLRVRLAAAGVSPDAVEERVRALKDELAALPAAGEEEAEGEAALMKDLLAIDPVASLKRLRVPFLVAYGERDAEVPAAHQAVLRTALGLGTRVAYRVHVLASADHDFLETERGRAFAPDPFAATDLARPRHPALMLYVEDFLESLLPPAGAGR